MKTGGSKTFFLAALLIFAASNATAMGAGFSAEVGIPAGVSRRFFKATFLGEIKSDRLPLLFAAGTRFERRREEGKAGCLAVFESPFLQGQIKNNFYAFFGAGVSAEVGAGFDKNFFAAFGGRAFFGFSWLFFADYFELYLEQSASPSGLFKSGGLSFFAEFPARAGARWHF